MLMLIGEYSHNLDSKNRLAIPARFREQLSDKLYAVEWMDNCIAVYDQEQWYEMVKKFMNLSVADEDARRLARDLGKKSSECTIDAQGRILLPAFQLKHLNFKKSCKINGVFDHFEIWPEETYEEYSQDERSLSELAKTQKERL